jgi:hypothetical protein
MKLCARGELRSFGPPAPGACSRADVKCFVDTHCSITIMILTSTKRHRRLDVWHRPHVLNITGNSNLKLLSVGRRRLALIGADFYFYDSSKFEDFIIPKEEQSPGHACGFACSPK